MNIVRPQEYQAKVVTKKKLSPKVFLMQLEAPRAQAFTPGQYASFLIDSHRRPLSFASLPTEPLLDFVIDVSPQGVCSNYTEALQLGDTVRFLSPYGRFTLEQNFSHPLLFIATGAGIAPIRGHIKQLAAASFPQPTTLIFGNRSQEFMLFNQEFAELSQQYPQFQFIPTLSEPENTWQGQKGLVTTVTPQVIKNIPNYHAYVCGGPAMVRDTIAMLQGHGMPTQSIKSEKFTE